MYVLVRAKRGQDPGARLASLLAGPLFEKLSGVAGRVAAVYGDLELPGLGISSEDVALLARDVEIVLHCAATVRFDEEPHIYIDGLTAVAAWLCRKLLQLLLSFTYFKFMTSTCNNSLMIMVTPQDLSRALRMNVGAVAELVSLCKKMARLQALVHVSTAYCHCQLEEVGEREYPAPLPPRPALALLDTLNTATLDNPDFTRSLIGERPNTYTFTKVGKCRTGN